MASLSGIVRVIGGAAAVALGVAAEIGAYGLFGPLGAAAATTIAPLLISAGAGMVLQGIGSIVAGNHQDGYATSTRHPIAPWHQCIGQSRVGGTMVYMNQWGANNSMLDMVIVLAAHPCKSIDEVLFDQQRIWLYDNLVPSGTIGQNTGLGGRGAIGGSTHSPIQTTANITSISRSANGVVTVTMASSNGIPLAQPGDQVIIQNVTVDQTLNGKFQIAQILATADGGGIVTQFTFLNGGNAVTGSNGQVKTAWADYGSEVYVEYLLGDQILGQTFVGMQVGTPYKGNVNLLVAPQNPNGLSITGASSGGGVGGSPQPNPWTSYCSLVGKTAVFIRMQYDQQNFPSGLPQISFLVSGKNNIYDPRNGAATGILQVGCTNGGSNFKTGDLLSLGQSGASGGQLAVGSVGPSGNILSWTLTNSGVYGTTSGSGYALGALTVSGGHGSGAAFTVLALGGAAGACGYSTNAALCIADYLADTKIGYGASYVTPTGTAVPFNSINVPDLVTTANVCDQAIELAEGGTEPMYSCNGQFDADMSRGEILQNLLTSCAGRLSYVGGQYYVQPGYWTGASAPSFDLMENAAGPLTWRSVVPVKDLCNAVKGTYISEANHWQSSDFPYYAQDALHGYSGPAQYGGDINLAADGGIRRYHDIHLPFTTSPSMAQRIAKIELMRKRQQGTGTFVCGLSAYQFQALDVIQASHGVLGWEDLYMEVGAVRFRASEQAKGKRSSVVLTTELDLQQTSPAVYEWSPTEELTPQGYQQASVPNAIEQAQGYCLPWSPGYLPLLTGDAIGGPATFGLQPIYTMKTDGTWDTQVAIYGAPPINVLDNAVDPPQILATASNTGGSLAPGTYVLALSAFDAAGENIYYGDFANVTVGGSGAGSIAVDIQWPSPVNYGGELYATLLDPWPNGYLGGFSEQQLLISAIYFQWLYQFHLQNTVAAGASSYTLTSYNQNTRGGPDSLFNRFGIAWQKIVHSGVWAQQVQAVTSNTVTIAGPAMTTNQYAGYVASLLAKFNSSAMVPVINAPVQSNTASAGSNPMFTLTIGPNAQGQQLPDLTTLLAVGDLLVMRGEYTFTASSFTDPNVNNGYYTSGASGVEAGHLAVVMTGADQGDVQTISSVSTTVRTNDTFNIAGKWTVTPATGDIVIVIDPAQAQEFPSAAFGQNKAIVSGVVAQPDLPNYANQTWLVTVRTEDQAGNHGPDWVAPKREIYIFGAGESVAFFTA